MSTFYRLSGSDDDAAADIVKSWKRKLWRTRDESGDIVEQVAMDPPGLAITCAECGQLREGTRSVNVPLVKVEIRSALHWPGFSGIGLIRRDLIETLGWDLVTEHLFLGNVVDEDGRAFSDFETYVGRYSNTIRGTGNPKLRACPSCGRRVYFAVGRPFLSRAELTDVPISTDGRSLILREDVMARLRKEDWDFDVEALTVETSMPDGFPERLADAVPAAWKDPESP